MAILFITKPLQSHSMPNQSIFNLSPIFIPADPIQSSEPAQPILAPTNSANNNSPKVNPPVYIKKQEIKDTKKSKDKDYGI